MISHLINMEIPRQQTPIPVVTTNKYFTVKEYAISFLEGMNKTQRDRFKKMLEHGIESGMSVAQSYGVDYKDFINEVKKQLNLEV